MAKLKVMLVAGEASGDLHGAHLARALVDRDPGVRLFGLGGALMESAGVRLLYNPTRISAMGFTEVLRNVQTLRRLLARLARVLDRQRPDVVVLIDFPEFNMRLAEMAHQRGIPVVYYFSPSAWAWRKGRAKVVAGHATTVCAVFPFEADVYREAGARVTFVGHPLVDIVASPWTKEEAREKLGVQGNSPVIALLPGSRRQEVDNHMGPLVGAAERLVKKYPNSAFLLPLAHTIDRERVESKLTSSVPIRIVEGKTYEVLTASDAAACASGTVTLEAALLGTPIVAFYKASASTYWLAKRFYKHAYFTLPNIVAGRKIIEELVQEQVDAAVIAENIARLLDPERRNQIIEDYREVRERLGGPGAVGRAADEVLAVARGERSKEERAPRGG